MRFFVSFFVLLMVAAAPAHAGSLTVEISGIGQTTGIIMVALEKSSDDFDREPFFTPKYQSRVLPAATKPHQATFEVPAGTYAIKVFHDTNGNGILDTNFFGVPTEPYGFSNGARPTFGPASFDEAKFTVRESAQTVRIMLD
jgi:uncharacterized protein (DUF2141 family)